MKANFEEYKMLQFKSSLEYSVKTLRVHFEAKLQRLKDTTTTSLSIEKIKKIEELDQAMFLVVNQVTKYYLRIKKKADSTNIQDLMLGDDRPSYASILGKAFNKYHQAYRQKNFDYLSDTTSWTRRYIQLLPKKQRMDPPSFGEFYFKGASKSEVLLTLNMLQLAIMQEALEIQQKIIDEK